MQRWKLSARGLARTVVMALTLAGVAGASQAANIDVGVSVEISQPGVYGRVDIGRYPPPQVVVQRPVVIEAPRVIVAEPEPVYLWVPPGHRRDWRRHCSRYNACGVPVYFVRERWYQDHVHRGQGRYRDDRVSYRDGRRDDRRDDRRDERRDERWDDRRDNRRDDDRRGNGHGRGHD
ncbi:hypothetical protein [Sphaerotilus mobilis]|uniref:Uncharacterized protein n=1 Tax=Sphaerotilus mobilis TaxID=47994 RepID=A0A4Q7LBW6_9BURK|nr:hypothetical protein [Sphaerotilus mobilis]RZS47554.1 hypothetical protein EV685_3764 [Sphaerotilus mobilis]